MQTVKPYQVRVSAVMAFVAIIAVWMAAARVHPILGVCMILPGIPALLTFFLMIRHHWEKRGF